MKAVRRDYGRGPQDTSRLLARVRATLTGAGLDCACQGRLESALARFTTLEEKREIRARIVGARREIERIAALIELMGELDAITGEEEDRSVFFELAHLFADVRAAAARGEALMRDAAKQPADAWPGICSDAK